MLPFTNKSRDELLKESRLLYQKLNAQIKQISKAKVPLLKDAANRFEQFRHDFRYNDFSKYSDKMVQNIYRDLKYIDSLKSSTVEGAIEALEVFGETKEFLDALSPDKRDEFWEVYNRAYKLMPELMEKYKYDIFMYTKENMGMGQDVDEIYQDIKAKLDRAYENEYLTEDEQKDEWFSMLLDNI